MSYTASLMQWTVVARNPPVFTAVFMATVLRFGRCGIIPCAFPLNTLPNLPLPTYSEGKSTELSFSKKPMVRSSPSSHTKHFLKLQICSRKLKLLELLQPRWVKAQLVIDLVFSGRHWKPYSLLSLGPLDVAHPKGEKCGDGCPNKETEEENAHHNCHQLRWWQAQSTLSWVHPWCTWRANNSLCDYRSNLSSKSLGIIYIPWYEALLMNTVVACCTSCLSVDDGMEYSTLHEYTPWWLEATSGICTQIEHNNI